MSTKATIKARDPKDGMPGFHLYDDALDSMFESDQNTPVYLRLDGVEVELTTTAGGGASVTVELPREVAADLGLLSTPDKDCICKGNWRAIVAESQPLLDRYFLDSRGNKFLFYGVVNGSDDYYYGMLPTEGGKPMLLSCVGSLEGHGFTLIE